MNVTWHSNASHPFYVRRSRSKHGGWDVWGPMGSPAFVGGHSWHSNQREAAANARRLNAQRVDSEVSAVA